MFLRAWRTWQTRQMYPSHSRSHLVLSQWECKPGITGPSDGAVLRYELRLGIYVTTSVRCVAFEVAFEIEIQNQVKTSLRNVSVTTIFTLQVLATNCLGIKFRKIEFYTHEYWDKTNNDPTPIWDLMFCTAFFGYTFWLIFVVVSSISHKIPTGKYVRN